MSKYNPDQFFKWLSEPMKPEEVELWNMANNILPELSDLFRDYCLSLFYLVDKTYLGSKSDVTKDTVILMSEKDNVRHFQWCWVKTIDNFKKENITFQFETSEYNFFKEFFFEVFYSQDEYEIKEGLNSFLIQLFDRNRKVTKSDLEMFTDVYKTLERALQI